MAKAKNKPKKPKAPKASAPKKSRATTMVVRASAKRNTEVWNGMACAKISGRNVCVNTKDVDAYPFSSPRDAMEAAVKALAERLRK